MVSSPRGLSEQEGCMRRRDGSPLWIADCQQGAIPLHRADLVAKSASGHYDEAWLQTLLHSHPEVLPIGQIESGYGDLVPLCRELPLLFGGGRSGALDNLFVTRDGKLVLVEAKLWRNPQARREVVAQVLEYAAAVFRMSYDELQSAVLEARRVGGMPAASLFEIVAGREWFRQDNPGRHRERFHELSHGEGFLEILRTRMNHDRMCRRLADGSGAAVLAIGYRLPPAGPRAASREATRPPPALKAKR